MNYVFLHCFFMIYLCNRRILSYSPHLQNDYHIDDFINQLILSQKFDELTDMIADKAVRRLKGLNIDSGPIDVQKYIGKNTAPDYRYRDDVYGQESQETPLGVFSENGGPVFKTLYRTTKHDNYKASRLEPLKFRYLTKSEREAPDEHTSGSDEKKNIYNEGRMEMVNQIQPIINMDNRNITVWYRDVQPLNNMEPIVNYDKHNADTHFINKKGQVAPDNNYNNIPEFDDSVKKYNTELLISQPQVKSERIPNITQRERDNEELQTIIRLDDKGEQFKKLNKPKKYEPAVKSVSEERNFGSNIESTEDAYVPQDNIQAWKNEGGHLVQTVESNDEGIPVRDERNEDNVHEHPDYISEKLTTRRPMIRKEGDKYFTYLTAPEYAEYHEMLEKQAEHDNNQFYPQ